MSRYNGSLFCPKWACPSSEIDRSKKRKEELKQSIENRYGLYLSVSQIMELLPVGRSTVYNAIQAGHLHADHIGRRIIVSASDLVEYIHKSE